MKSYIIWKESIMDKIKNILDIVVEVRGGAWFIYSFVTTRKTLKSLTDEYDD